MAFNELDEPQKVSGFDPIGMLWDRHRARRKLAFDWFDDPFCLCCGRPLVRIKNTRKQHCFLQGHQVNLEILAAQVVRGEASPDEIPDVTKSLSGFIPFLRKRPDLRKAFE